MLFIFYIFPRAVMCSRLSSMLLRLFCLDGCRGSLHRMRSGIEPLGAVVPVGRLISIRDTTVRTDESDSVGRVAILFG